MSPDMVAHAIDFLLFFFIAFISVFVSYFLMVKKEENDDKNAILNERIARLVKQQDALLQEAGERASTFAKNKKEDGSQNERSKNGFQDKVTEIMHKAGISEMDLKTFEIWCAAGGVLFAFITVYFDFLNYITGIPIGFCVGTYLVYLFLSIRADARKHQFLAQLPDAIDMMIRGVKAGLNINRVIKLVSMESRDPIASEYLTISQKLDLGIKPEEVFVEAADRINLDEFRFLVVALVLQIENGGVLAEILANLSAIIRKRLELELKMKAMSSEAKTSAIVLGALPFCFAGLMMILNPSHMAEFTKPGAGQNLLKALIVLFSLGVYFMMKATKLKI